MFYCDLDFYFFITLFASVASFDLNLSFYTYCHLCDLFMCCNISQILFYCDVFVCFIINVCCNVATLCHHSALQEGLHLYYFFQLLLHSLCSSSFAAMSSFAPLCLFEQCICYFIYFVVVCDVFLFVVGRHYVQLHVVNKNLA